MTQNKIIAYLGTPLFDRDGYVLGTLCRVDDQPRNWTHERVQMHVDLAAFVSTEVEARRAAAAEVAAQNALRLNEARATTQTRLRGLANAMPQIVWTADPNGNLDYYNQRWFDYTGLSFEETKDWGWQAVMHPDELEDSTLMWKAAVAKGELHEGDTA